MTLLKHHLVVVGFHENRGRFSCQIWALLKGDRRLLYSSNGRKITGFPKKMPARESSKLGTALHEIIQDVLSQPKDCRESSKKRMLEILSLMRSERRIPQK